MLNKGIQKIINSFLSALLALTCFNVYTVTADDDTTTVSETPIETEVKDLNEVDAEETADTLEESETQTVADETENNVEESTETEETTVESSPVEIADATETVEPQQEENAIEAKETQESQQVETADEESSEQALDLNTLTADELFAYIMSIDANQMDALYDEYDNLDDLMDQFSDEQKTQLAEKFGNSEEDIETLKTTTYYGKFSPAIEHATVAFCTWKGNSEVLDPTLTVVDGTVNISDYATNKATGYIVFFVKPETNYMITGLNASGNGDYYSLDSTSFGNIGGWFAKQTALIEKAKSEGYIGVFGYSSSNSNKEASFEVIGQQPSLNVRDRKSVV